MARPRRSRTVSRSVLEPAGPWTHRQISAGGASFHVADAGPESPGHAVVLLHPFPLSWWAWREVIPALVADGHRVVAMDLRGFGTSDLQRDDPDLVQLADDVTAVISAMGIAQFSVVGTGMGGAVAWMLGAQDPISLRTAITVASPHPLERRHGPLPGHLTRGALLELRLDVPLRRVLLLENGRLVTGLIREWAAPANRERLITQSGTYRAAMARPFAASSATETFQATRHPNLASRRLLAEPVRVPVLSVQCGLDGSLTSRDFGGDIEHVSGTFAQVVLPTSGHFAPEEAPAELAVVVLDHLARTPARTI